MIIKKLDAFGKCKLLYPEDFKTECQKLYPEYYDWPSIWQNNRIIRENIAALSINKLEQLDLGQVFYILGGSSFIDTNFISSSISISY